MFLLNRVKPNSDKNKQTDFLLKTQNNGSSIYGGKFHTGRLKKKIGENLWEKKIAMIVPDLMKYCTEEFFIPFLRVYRI